MEKKAEQAERERARERAGERERGSERKRDIVFVTRSAFDLGTQMSTESLELKFETDKKELCLAGNTM